MSAKMALEQLGFGPCRHMVEVMGDPSQHPRWDARAAGPARDRWRRLPGDRHAGYAADRRAGCNGAQHGLEPPSAEPDVAIRIERIPA
jgi:hypothetical protein